MSKQFKNNLLHVATLGKVVGLRGDMKLHIKSDFPEQFQKGMAFYLSPSKKVTIDHVNFQRGTIKLEGFNTPEEAKSLTNAKLYTTIEETRKNCRLEQGQYFWFDIEECEVYEENQFLGKVVEIERILENDYLKIKTSQILIEKGYAKFFLIPYLEQFIQKVDIQAKKIYTQGAFDILEAS